MKKTAKSFFALLTAFLLILPLFPVGIFDAAAEDGGIVVAIDDDPVEIIATLGEQDEEEE